MSDETGTAIYPRPSRFDTAVLREAAEKLFPRVAEWLAQNEGFDESGEREEIVGQLAEALDSSDLDGYAIAKRLDDRYCWSPDSSLVDILESAPHKIYEATQSHVREWVAANAVRPALAVGETVTWDRGRGVIVAIKAETAEYVVQEEGKSYPAPSRIKKSDGSEGVFCCGTILAFERVKAIG